MISKVSPTVVAIKEQRSFEYFDVEKMSPVKIGPQTNNHFMGSNATPLDQGKTVNLNGRVTERNTGELLRIVHTTLPAATAGVKNQVHLGSRNTIGQKAWGRQISTNGMLTNSKGSRISQPSNVRMATISEDYPVGILLTQISERRIQKHMISFCSLIDGTILQSSTIKEAAPAGRTSYYGNRNLIIAKGKKILLALENEIHFADIPDSILKSAPIPPHFSQKQKTFIQVGKTESFPLEIIGNREGVTFSLMQEYEGLNLNESSGEIQVDTKTVWDKFAKQATLQSSRFRSSRNGQSSLSSDANTQEYQRITGKNLSSGMTAAQLPIKVSLRDAEGQQDELAFAVIITGSRKSIDDAVQKAAQEREKLQAEARKRQEEAMRARSAAQRAALEQKPEPGSVSERIDKIEARMRRIEAALDAVLKKLDEQNQ